MGCNCGDNEYEIIVDNNGSCEPTTPEYYITLENVGVDGFSPTINQVNITSSSFQLQITDVNGTETTGDIPLLSYLDDNFVTNTDLADTLTAYVTSTSLATTLTDYVTNTSLATTLADYVTNSDLTTTLTNYVTNSSLSSTLSAYALDANVVHKANTETITGKKIFDNEIQVGYIDAEVFGSLSIGTSNATSVDIGRLTNGYTRLRGDVIYLNGSSIIATGANFTWNGNNVATTNQIPTVGDGTITITQGGVSKGTFTTNQSGNTTIDLDATSSGGLATDGSNADANITINNAKITVVNPSGSRITSDNGKLQLNSSITYLSKGSSQGIFLNSAYTGIYYNSSGKHITIDSDKSYYTTTNGSGTASEEIATKGDLPTTMVGADSITGGSSGLVPAPAAGDEEKYLRGDGTWHTVSGGGSSYTAGTGIDITNDTISIDTSVVAQLSDIPDTSDMATETWVGNQGYLTTITSSDVTNALGFTPYNSSNPNGYTSNVGTVTSVNSVQPDGNGDVSISIPTVNNPTITFTQGGVSKGTITLNQSSNQTIALDAGGGGGAVIDDTQASSSTVYSSQKTQDLIDALVTRITALENNINGGNA